MGGLSGSFTPPVFSPQPWAVAVADFNLDGTPDVAIADLTANVVQALLGDGLGAVLPPSPPVGVAAMPTALATGDFNRDGIPDLVSANASGSVQIVIGNGNGTFVALAPFPLVGNPQDVVAGDFNRDGFLDAAVAASAGFVHLVLGNGAGGWLGANTFGVVFQASSLAAGDLDLDGDLDVVVGDAASPALRTLIGDGGPNLFPQPLFPGPLPFTTSVVLADFDSDGRLDLGTTGLGNTGVAAALGDGAGGFTAFTPFGVPQDPFALAAGDFDGDGRPDLVGSGTPVNQAVLLVNLFGLPCPNASFARAGRLQVPLSVNTTWAVVAGDWDGDAVPDLAVAGNSTISILPGDGTLAFAAPTNIPLSPGAISPNDRRSLVVADFNLDSRPDLATVNPTSGFANDDSLGVVLNAGGGAFAAPAFVLLPINANPWGVVAGDFNRDGAPDLVSADRGSVTLTFFPGLGDGTFGAPTTTPAGLGGLAAIAAADIDGDQRLDVAVAHDSSNLVRWYQGDGTGGFSLGGSVAVGSTPQSVDLGDLNGDSRPDLAVANTLDDTVSVALNTGAAFGPAVTYAVGDEPLWVRIGPADDDGDADLVVPGRSTDDVTVLLNDGSGAFPTSTLVGGYQEPTAAIVLDADRNGRSDLAVVNGNLAGSLIVLPGDGLGGFGPRQVSPPTGAVGPRSVASGDFNRDSRPDLVTLDTAVNDMSFLKGLGDGTFDPPVAFPTGIVSPQGLGVGDFNGDGALDVVVGASGTTAVSLLRGDGAGGFLAPLAIPSSASGTSPYGIAVGDFDRDGKLDFTRVTSTAATTHYGDGTGVFVAELSTTVGPSPADIVVLDFDRDGILDLAVSSYLGNTVWLLKGSGARLSPPFTRQLPDLVTNAFPAGLAAGDVDNDGVTDLVVGQVFSNPGQLGYFRGLVATTPPFFAPRSDYDLDDPTRIEPDGVALADMNGDGRLDALVACRGGSSETRASVRVLAGTGNPAPGLAFDAADVWAVAQRSASMIEVADFNVDGKPDIVAGEGGALSGGRLSVVLNTNCQARRLRPVQEPSRCNTAGAFFATQPKVQVEDDGANPLLCNADPVSVSEAGGTVVSGTTPLGTTSGVADWSTAPLPLFMNDPGSRYRLRFAHPSGGLTHSWTFSVSPSLTVVGPDNYCASSPGLFSTDLGFDYYRWYVNPPWPNPLSFTDTLTIGAGALSAGPYVAQVDATVDTCPVGANKAFDVFDDLSSVSVAPPGPQTVCTTCTGGNLTATETGGGAVTRQWGYRATSGGAITFIPGETGTSYLVDGADFPGQGTYYVVVETTPQCGIPTVSNEVQVDVEVTATGDVPPVFTVTSTDGSNRLEWAYPPGRTTVRIRYNTNSDWASCVPPATEGSGFADIPDQTAPVNFVDHMSLTNDLTYCYSIFVDTGGGVFPSTTRQTVNGRPFDTGGLVKWAYSTGAASLAPPGLGSGVIHVVSNNSILHSVVKGLGGGWPAGWTPFVATGPSQSRPSTVAISIPPASHAIYLGSQSGAGINSVAVDADTGNGLWGQPLGLPVQAGPAGIFTAYGGSMDAILLGTSDAGNPNTFHALDPLTGNPLPGFPYNGEPPGNEIGRISAQAAVDYPNERVFFTSYSRAGGDTVWCVELATGSRCPLWPVGGKSGFGHIAAGPTLRGNRLYVAPIRGAHNDIEALDADTGALLWSAPFTPNNGWVKLFVLPDFFSTDLYFSTNGEVWSIRDDGNAAGLNWQRGITDGSQPVYYAGTGRVWVGSGDGNLYILNSSDGLNAVAPIQLGDGNFTVGAPTVDQAGGFVYVGSDAGVVYAVAIP
jgi:hypothetical protein